MPRPDGPGPPRPSRSCAGNPPLREPGYRRFIAGKARRQLQSALEQVDRAGPQHNTDLADAIYEQIVNLAADGRK